MITQRQYVDRLGEVRTSVGDLVTNVQDLGGRLISVRDDACARVQTEGKENIGKTEGTRVGMVVAYLRNDFPVLEKKPRFPLGLARKLVAADSQGKYYSTSTSEDYDKARKKAEDEAKSGIEPAERTAIVLPSRNFFSMSPDENPELYAFVFEDMTELDELTGRKSYFQLNGPVRFYPIEDSIVDGKNPQLLTVLNGSVINYVWFSGLSNMSWLNGNNRYAIDCNSRSRGVLKRSAEGASRKIYTPTLAQILKYSKPFIPEAVRINFETGLRGLYKKQ